MKNIETKDIQSANTRLVSICPSHTDTRRVKEGWQIDMWEKEITNHDGYGPSIKVYGRTKEEAEAMALIVSRKMTLSLSTETGGNYLGLRLRHEESRTA